MPYGTAIYGTSIYGATSDGGGGGGGGGGGATTTVGYTLTQYRQRLGEAAGFHMLLTTTAAAAAANQLVIAELQSTELPQTYLQDTWEYQPFGGNAGEQRRVQAQGLNGGTGTVTVSRSHSVATPSGTAVEFYGKLPATRTEGRLGLNQIVNKVLSECWVIVKFSIAGVDGQAEYPLGTPFPWLNSEDQIIDVLYRPANAAATDVDTLMPRWRFTPGGADPVLEIPPMLAAGDTLKPVCYVPMSWWIGPDGGTFQQPTTEGLSVETDLGLLDLEGMEIVGRWYVYDELAKWGAPDDQVMFLKLRDQQRVAANEYKRVYLQHIDGREDHWDSVVSVSSSRSYGFQVLSRG